jgi:hypothetical protein
LHPSSSLLAEAARFWSKMSWYWVKFIMPLTLTRAPGSEEVYHINKQTNNKKVWARLCTQECHFVEAMTTTLNGIAICRSNGHPLWAPDMPYCRIQINPTVQMDSSSSVTSLRRTTGHVACYNTFIIIS